MALINCDECGNEVSEKAEACPECGAPVESGGGSFTLESRGESSSGCAKVLLIVLGIVFFVVVYSNFQGDNSSNNSSNTSEPSPAFKMQQVFEGNYSVNEIKRELNKATKQFNKPNTDKAKMGMGDILLTLRRKYDVHEVKILRCANSSSHNYPKFKKAAAVCVSRLED